MFQHSVLACFLLATVSGQLQIPLQRGLLLSTDDKSQAVQRVSGVQAHSASPKPCRRRNHNVENPDVLSTEPAWVQTFHSQSVLPLDQKISREAVENQRPSRPLSEYLISIQQDNNVLVENDTDLYLKKAPEENDIAVTLNNDHIDDQIDNQDEICQILEEVENDAESVDKDSNLNSDSKDGSDEVRKQALELLTKCIGKGNGGKSDESDGNTRRSNNDLNATKTAENSYAYQPAKSTERKEARKFRNKKLNTNEKQVQPNPAQGEGISNIADSRVLLLQNSRVCFACTTTNDPSCWNPDQTTTVKYCKKEDDACITKTFKTKNDLITVRDCGNSCTDSDYPGVPLRYKTCRICHSDQCNGAYAISSFNVLVVVFIVSAIKYTF